MEEAVEEVEVRPQEFTYTDRLAGLAVFRLDFIATIKTSTGEFKKVLIEIQKAKNAIDLMRFRNYLGEQYKKEDEIQTNTGRQKTTLPIVTIYLLGFQLPEILSSAVKVSRQYIDLLTHTVIEQKSDFIEKLTHDCFVVQLPRIESKFQSRLDKLLSIFEQNYFVDDKGIIKEFNHPVENETVIKSMVDILHYAGTDPGRRKEIEDEQEAYRVLDNAAAEKAKEFKGIIAEQAKALEDKDKVIEEKDKELEDKERIIAELMTKLNQH